MSVPFNKFDCFLGDLGLKLHNLNTDSLKVYLTNTAPVVGNTVYNTPADLATSGGYTAGGAAITNSYSQVSGQGQLVAVDTVFTATTGFGPFRYAVIYNNTAAVKNLIGWLDYGAAVTLGASEVFTVDFAATVLTIG
jgi:hypothetical protein